MNIYLCDHIKYINCYFIVRIQAHVCFKILSWPYVLSVLRQNESAKDFCLRSIPYGPYFQIDKKMFEKALLAKDREEFINLFLSQGVRVHKFLNHKKLKLLFEKAEDREFFQTVVLEGILGVDIVSFLL